MIEEVKQGVGSWDIKLKPETPRTVRTAIQPYGYLFVTPAHVVDPSMGLNALMTMSFYAGVVIDRGDQFLEPSGWGVLALLGTPNGVGRFGGTSTLANDLEDHITTPTAGTPPLPAGGTNGIKAGTISGGSSALLLVDEGTTHREQLNVIIDAYQAFFRLRWPTSSADSTFTIDASTTEADIVNTSPTVLFWTGSGGIEPDIVGFNSDVRVPERTVEEWQSDVYVSDADGNSGTDTASTQYQDIEGNDLDLTRYERTDADAQLNDVAASVAQGRHAEARRIEVEAEVFNPHRWVECGDYVMVYDLPNDLYISPPWSVLFTVTFRGQTIAPQRQTLEAMRHPVLPGYGVYHYVDQGAGGTITDLTRWVEFEEGPATFEVEWPRQRLNLQEKKILPRARSRT